MFGNKKKEPEYKFRACNCGDEHDAIKTALRIYSDTIRKSVETSGNVCPVWQEHVATTLQILWFNHAVNIKMQLDEKALGQEIPDSAMEAYSEALIPLINTDRHILSTLLGTTYNAETQLAYNGKLEVMKTH